MVTEGVELDLLLDLGHAFGLLQSVRREELTGGERREERRGERDRMRERRGEKDTGTQRYKERG